VLAPLVLHLHGGAFVGGSLDSGQAVAILLASAGAVVVSADYPLAPERRFPQSLEVAFDLLTFLHKTRSRWVNRKSGLFVAGEEAGGNLAAGLALMARDRRSPPIAGQILLSPMLDPCLATHSVRAGEAGPAGCLWANGWQQYLGSAEKAGHPYASPLQSSRLSGLAPALIITAEDDLLRDESLSYGQRLRDAGVPVETHILPAPTGWPCGLSERDPLQASWGHAVCDRFTAFFNHTTSDGARSGRAPTTASAASHTELARN
jgi:acetyl esterase/lipase